MKNRDKMFQGKAGGTILTTTPKREWETMPPVKKEHKERVVPVTVKGRGHRVIHTHVHAPAGVKQYH